MTVETLVVAALALALGSCVAGGIAYHKGGSFWTAWFFSIFMSPLIMIPITLFASRDEQELERRRLGPDKKRCDYCKSIIRRDASVCPQCRRDLGLQQPA